MNSGHKISKEQSMYDPELPAGYQDADFEMRELEARGNRAARLRAKGICTHGHVQGGDFDNPDKPSEVKCLNCPATFPTMNEWHQEHRSLIG